MGGISHCATPEVCHDLDLAAIASQIVEQELGATGPLSIYPACTLASEPWHRTTGSAELLQYSGSDTEMLVKEADAGVRS